MAEEGAQQLAAVARRAAQAGDEVCIVINDQRVVLGRLRGVAFDRGSDAVVEDVMEEGPVA